MSSTSFQEGIEFLTSFMRRKKCGLETDDKQYILAKDSIGKINLMISEDETLDVIHDVENVCINSDGTVCMLEIYSETLNEPVMIQLVTA